MTKMMVHWLISFRLGDGRFGNVISIEHPSEWLTSVREECDPEIVLLYAVPMDPDGYHGDFDADMLCRRGLL